MWYLKVSQREDVIAAIKEYDKLGRIEFLAKYDFSKAKEYFLVYEGQLYDCKPLIYGAYVLKFGEKLTTRRSQGVQKTIRPYLESMGFTIIKAGCSFRDIVNDLKERVEDSEDRESAERLERLKSAPRKPSVLTVKQKVYIRNADVIAEQLFRAKGKCQSCKKTAPFVRASNGTPYLEVHHITPLSQGGDDTLENTIALCPNCHRQQHFGLRSI
ncbi:HNH endonuclease [Pseudoalteromonas sp.]|uniref:HNH endonuclease n=1 Tax=Pseudoalteromonas sp. TaxID=53249 RepID=UPI002606BE75|nr:HNH endonuclease [Pseudoalteromonas sp.]MCP4588878.1 hypothetical protein [Pseudoalteromonas sp.]